MALQLLERDRGAALRLSSAIAEAAEHIGRCQQCRTLTESTLCNICRDPRREEQLLCVVETPADVFAIEQSGSYRGRYFVLLGHLSPLDGIGPEELGLDQLEQRLRSGHVQELILATSSTVEGEATAHYIAELARECDVRATRIAHGLPQSFPIMRTAGRLVCRAESFYP